ncbi:hypothetical protein LCGC14_1319900, partial [marine sediment metagenome]
MDKREIFNLKTKLNELLFSHGLKENYYYNPLVNIFKEIHKERIDSENYNLDSSSDQENL